jgi:Tfp pilus assembly protein PilF
MKSINQKLFILIFLAISIASGGISVSGEISAINSKSLSVNYSIPSNSIGKDITLWYRIDNDPKWTIGVNIRAGKPMQFNAPKDGVYTFCLSFSDRDNKPAPPTTAEIAKSFRCLVDCDTPLLQITSVSYESGKITTRWNAFDANFDEKPITLYLITRYATRFIGKFANTGAAVIPADDDDFPAKIKLSAEDRAGNIQADESSIISLAQPNPTTKPASSTTRPARVKGSLYKHISVDPVKREQAEKELHRGRLFLYKNEAGLARQHFARAVELNPMLTDAHINLAELEVNQKHYPQAEDHYLRVITLDPENVKAWQGLARTKARQFKHLEAKKCLERAVKLDDNNEQSWLALGDSLWLLGQRDEARSAWKKAETIHAVPDRSVVTSAADSN